MVSHPGKMVWWMRLRMGTDGEQNMTLEPATSEEPGVTLNLKDKGEMLPVRS